MLDMSFNIFLMFYHSSMNCFIIHLTDRLNIHSSNIHVHLIKLQYNKEKFRYNQLHTDVVRPESEAIRLSSSLVADEAPSLLVLAQEKIQLHVQK